MAVASYRQLLVWQKAMDLAVACYHATEQFPKAQTYRLCDQLQRAAVSVPSNIAEGQGRYHTAEFIKHLSYANGSRCEAETQIMLAERLGYLSPDQTAALLATSEEIGRMLSGLTAALRNRQDSG